MVSSVLSVVVFLFSLNLIECIACRSTVVSLSSFLDTLQKIADIATGARGE